MKIRLCFALILLAGLALNGLAQDAAKMKLGIIELAAFRSEIAELKQKYDKLQAEFEPKQRELASIQSSIEAKQKTLQETPNLTQQQAAKLQGEIQDLQREGQRKGEDAQALAQKREQEETGAIYEKGITHVLEAGRLREGGLVVYAAPASFITDDFIKEYNKANPATAAAVK
jgi:Skp family chaperone for outer membrane proteins